jgi:hypothetical protein
MVDQQSAVILMKSDEWVFLVVTRVIRSDPDFSEISPLYTGYENKPNKKPAEVGSKLRFQNLWEYAYLEDPLEICISQNLSSEFQRRVL